MIWIEWNWNGKKGSETFLIFFRLMFVYYLWLCSVDIVHIHTYCTQLYKYVLAFGINMKSFLYSHPAINPHVIHFSRNHNFYVHHKLYLFCSSFWLSLSTLKSYYYFYIHISKKYLLSIQSRINIFFTHICRRARTS